MNKRLLGAVSGLAGLACGTFAGYFVGRDSARDELDRNSSCLEVLNIIQEDCSVLRVELEDRIKELFERAEYNSDAAVYIINTARMMSAKGLDINDYMHVPKGSTLSELIWIGENGGVAATQGEVVRVTMPDGNYFLPASAYRGFNFPRGLDLEIDGARYNLGNEITGEEWPSGVLLVRENSN